METIDLIVRLGKKVLSGGEIDMEEALELADIEDARLPVLFAMADQIRRERAGDAVELCAIVNGRSGRCSEDCKYCAQSKYHRTGAPVYPLLSEEEMLLKAKQAEAGGANRFAIVTSGKGSGGGEEFTRILAALRRIGKETRLRVCCSLGALTKESAKALKEAGVARYHHNIETSRRNFARICTTHTYEDRLETIRIARDAGLEICAGGILGMNETMRDRLDMFFEVKRLGAASIPLNILHPIPGTAFSDRKPLPPLEILKSFALCRFVAPDCGIRSAGGREANLRDLQAAALMSGLSGMMVGGYLTTGGRDYARDRQMLADLHRPPAGAVLAQL